MKKKKSNKLVAVLIVIAVLSVAAAGGTLAYIYYQNTHVFVEGQAYPLNATYLDLREEDISFAHYNALQEALPGCEILWNVPFQGKTGFPAMRRKSPSPTPAQRTSPFWGPISPSWKPSMGRAATTTKRWSSCKARSPR